MQKTALDSNSVRDRDTVTSDKSNRIDVTTDSPSPPIKRRSQEESAHPRSHTYSPAVGNANLSDGINEPRKMATGSFAESEFPQPFYVDPIYIVPFLIFFILIVVAVVTTWKIRTPKNKLRGKMRKAFENVLSIKNELEEDLFSSDGNGNVHAIGVGSAGENEGFVVNVYVEDASRKLRDNPLIDVLPEKYKDSPIVIVEMPPATAISDGSLAGERSSVVTRVVAPGMSISNSSMWREAGTIGYFCKPSFVERAKRAFLSSTIYLLSNKHVLVDLTLSDLMSQRCVVHPGVGDGGGDEVAILERYTEIDFTGGKEKPNMLDAAIAVLTKNTKENLKIPEIGSVSGTLPHGPELLNRDCYKYGKKTKGSQGRIENIHFSAWVRYKANGKSAFFKDQLLIVPPDSRAFCDEGDSGSLVITKNNEQNLAVGLLFAGPDLTTPRSDSGTSGRNLSNYGVANPIELALSELKVKLITS